MKRYRLLLLSAALLLGSCVTAGGPMIGQAGREPTDEELVQDFLTVALREGGNEGDTAERPYLTRFHDPIRVRVHGPAAPQDRERIEALVARIRSSTGHDIAFAEANEPANYHVHLLTGGTPDSIAALMLADMPSLKAGLETELRTSGIRNGVALGQRRQQGQLCMALHYPWKHRPDLETAHVLIDRGMDAARRMNCLAEEMLQVLGLPGDTGKAWPSRFSDRPYPQDPSDYDWLYVRLLHDAEIRAGMTKTQARPIALARVAEWRSQGKRLAGNADNRRYDPERDVPSNELLLNRFMSWALAKESGAHVNASLSFLGRREALAKWSVPLKVLMTGKTERVQQVFDHIARGVSEVSGIDIVRAGSGEQNVHIHIEQNWSMNSVRVAFEGNQSPVLTARRQALVRSIIDADAKNYQAARRWVIAELRSTPDQRRTYHFAAARLSPYLNDNCHEEHVYKMMSGGIHMQLPWRSLALYTPDCDAEVSLYDLLFLRILYDPRLRADVKEAEALPVARQILAELRPDETRLPERWRLIHPAWRNQQARANKD